MPDRMVVDDEIDLRELLRVLWRGRRTIAGCALSAALVAVGLSVFVLPQAYESRVLLLVTRPQVQIVDPSSPAFRTGELNVTARTDPELSADGVATLARAPALIEEVARRAGVPVRKLESAQARAIRNSSLVELRVRWSDPQTAQRIAAVWAEVVVARARILASSRGQGSYALFGRRLDAALERLKVAEQALRHFDALSRIGELQARLGRLTDQLASYEGRRNDLSVSLMRAEGELAAIEAQLQRQPRTLTLSKSVATDPFFHQAVTTASGRSFLELSRLTLRTEEQNPVYTALSQARANAAVAAQALRVEKFRVEQAMQEIQREIATLRSELAAQTLIRTRLARDVENARRVYDVLFQRREEVRLAAATPSGSVQLAAPASRPDGPVSPRPVLNTIIAAVLGAMVGTLAVLVMGAWKGLAHSLAPDPPGKTA